jgi:hypothetical protein
MPGLAKLMIARDCCGGLSAHAFCSAQTTLYRTFEKRARPVQNERRAAGLLAGRGAASDQAPAQRCLRPWLWLVLCETRLLKSAMALAALALKR